MAILEKEVMVKLHTRTFKHYESLGYMIKRYTDKYKKERVDLKTPILVKVEHLSKGSSVKLTKVCDFCNKKVSEQSYNRIIECREVSNGIDRCQKCMLREHNLTTEEKYVAITHPEFAKLFWNQEETFKYSFGSNEKVDFKCQNCGEKIVGKIINDVHYKGLSCPRCSDGLKYPEKFMYNMLRQLNIEFETQKVFDWSNRKKYDFYLTELDCIIETHGEQHYEESNRGRSLEEEKANDKLKELLVKENKISKFVVIDCRKSEMEFIKRNVLDSKLSEIFDLSEVDWLKCNELACNSLVKEVCDMFNSRIKDTSELAKMLKLGRSTVIKYLKKGSGTWCNYDSKKELGKGRKKGHQKISEKLSKEIVQITSEGKVVFWKSATVAARELEFQSTNISATCNGKFRTMYGSKWMFKSDYDQLYNISN